MAADSHRPVDEERARAREKLGRNLVLARSSSNITQGELADLSGISRATIAQIESGEADPRLSTIVDLATALDTTPLMLLLGEEELSALAHFSGTDVFRQVSKKVSDEDAEQIRRLLASRLRRMEARAARLGAEAAATAVGGAVAGTLIGRSVGAAIGTVLLPGAGLAIGAALGVMLSRAFKNATGDKK